MPYSVILGIDAGGTNVDGVLLADGRIVGKAKVPRTGKEGEAIRVMLTELHDDWSTVEIERVVVATTRVVNATVQDRLPACTNLLIPGPGLDPERSFYGDKNEVLPGCVDHRGRVTEEAGYDGTPDTEVVAVTSKFASRNPVLEREVTGALDVDDRHVAMGNESGAGLTFPERAATTVANAKTKPIFSTYRENVADAIATEGIEASIYYLKGDGSMLGERTMRTAPAHTLRSGGGASTLGLLALTDATNVICVDIGGTTTDIARVTEGYPDLDTDAAQGDIEPAYAGVTSRSLSVGGDTRLEQGPRGPELANRRDGNAAAFGGEGPTVTDALHVLGVFVEGDETAAHEAMLTVAEGDAVEDAARVAVDRYADLVGYAIDELTVPGVTRIVVGGVLAPHLGERIAETTRWMDSWTVPEQADVAGAVGCAVARVSVETSVHIDSARGVMTVTSIGPESVEEVEEGQTFTDEAIHEIAADCARSAAGADGGDVDEPYELLGVEQFNVVQHGRIVGTIVDVRARVEPGYSQVVGTGS